MTLTVTLFPTLRRPRPTMSLALDPLSTPTVLLLRPYCLMASNGANTDAIGHGSRLRNAQPSL